MGDIIKNYKRFVNESIDPNIKSISDVPEEIFMTAKKIAGDYYDKTKKPTFILDPDKGLIMKFGVTDKDFNFVNEEDLKLDLNTAAKRKRDYKVVLIYDNSITETQEIQYIVNFEPNTDEDNIDFDDENNEEDFIDEYELDKKAYQNEDDTDDEEDIDRNIKKRMKRDIDIVEDDDDDDDDDILEEFNPLKKEDWKKAGKGIRKGIGILTKEEAIEKGREIVMNHVNRKKKYLELLEIDPEMAEKYLEFFGYNPQGFPKWTGEKWVDTASYSSNVGGSWGGGY